MLDCPDELNMVRPKRQEYDRVTSKDKFVFVALEALKVTLKAESTDAKKKRHVAIQNAKQATENSSDDDLYIEGSDIQPNGNVIVVARPMRSCHPEVHESKIVRIFGCMQTSGQLCC